MTIIFAIVEKNLQTQNRLYFKVMDDIGVIVTQFGDIVTLILKVAHINATGRRQGE